MSERLNLKMLVIGANPSGPANNPLTLDQSIKRIKDKGYQPNIEDGLINLLKKRPRNTYEMFFKNIYTYLRKLENNEKSS